MISDDGHLLDLLYDWTPDEQTRKRILGETPARLFAGRSASQGQEYDFKVSVATDGTLTLAK